MEFNELKKYLKKDFTGLNPIKLALLGDCATQLLSQAIKGYGYLEQINFNIFEADYNQIERQIFDQESELYRFNPQYVLIFYSAQSLQDKFYQLENDQKHTFADNFLGLVESFWQTLNSTLNCNIITFNLIEVNDNVFGNFGNKVEVSYIYQIRKINFKLMDLCRSYKNAFILDMSSLNNLYGAKFTFDPKIYISAKMSFSLDFLPVIAKNIVDIINAINGKLKKCLILDLDNTLWGGVIGDEGINNIEIGELGIGKAFSNLQMWVKQLKERGIILAVCSKNTDHIAKEPFEKHPDMVLRLNDIAVFVANWNNKPDNIKYIQSVLNIGFDSMVFIDDNPFERNMVKESLPAVSVPDLPEDPVYYTAFLSELNLFETANFAQADLVRTEQYQVEAKRIEFQQRFASTADYLMSLEMVSECGEINDYYVPRISQLTQRANQFNLRTIRYTEHDITRIKQSEEYLTQYFTLKDKFGDYGLISLVIMKKIEDQLFIDTWIMSCRVLLRGMEAFVLNKLVKIAQEKGFHKLVGEYIQTSKNELVKEHYQKLGFVEAGGLWELAVAAYREQETFIKEAVS